MRLLICALLVGCMGCTAGEAQQAKTRPLIDVVADRITKAALLSVVKSSNGANLPIVEIHASRSDEPLDVSLASVLVWSGEGRVDSLKSSAELANLKLGMRLELLTDGSDYVKNTVTVASRDQAAANLVANDPGRQGGALELKWNSEFTEAHAKDVVQLAPIFKAASDTAAIAKARDLVSKALVASPDLLKPFAEERPVPDAVVKSRARTKALIETARRSFKG